MKKYQKYRKKPIVIEAIQWMKEGDHPAVTIPTWSHEGGSTCSECGKPLDKIHGIINTLEGVGRVCPGDYIIKGIKGELYPCKPDIFEVTYGRQP